MPRRRGMLPVDLAAAVAGVEGVRRRRRGGGVPGRVWEVAAGLASCYGPERTARALGLDACELERRLGRRRRRAATADIPAFVEIVARPEAVSGACVLEIDGAGGLTVRLRLAVADAALLERILLALAKAPA